MNLKEDRIIVKNIKDKNDENNKPVYLVANSGIQFIDFEFDQKIDFSDDDAQAYPDYVVNGKFARHPKYGDHFARFTRDTASDNLVIEDFSIALPKGDKYGDDDDIPLLESLNLYNGVWFPIPYFCAGHRNGPTNWARARIVNLEDVNKRASGGIYHITFAFDTSIDNEFNANHCAPTASDINDLFTFRGGIEATSLLENSEDGNSYVREWAKSVFEKIYPETHNDSDKEAEAAKWIEKRFYEKHYLNLIAFLEHFVQPNDIKLMPYDNEASNPTVDVSLILDVGNSRSCGILVEEDDDNTSSLLRNPQLELRDLNAPENVYKGTFDSKIQFQRANFDFNYSSDISSRLDAFVWPSIVRVGTEASRLGANAKGNEGTTGLISPKRYLWQVESDLSKRGEWKFNNNYYQIPMMTTNQRTERPEIKYYKSDEDDRSATYLHVSKYMNSTGDALFADTGDESKMQANYSGKSTMTFMLVEIIMQALMQMNSFHYRQSKSNESRPRRLKALVLTSPPSMPDLEREVFRSCAYQALGIVWKAYGYDKTPVNEFKYIEKAAQMFPRPPHVILKWNETIASQLVYLYNETQRTFGGNSQTFIRHIRRADADGRFNEFNKKKFAGKEADYISARIASIDIGGGTTDLVITDYSTPTVVYSGEGDERTSKEVGNQTGIVELREILKDGFKIAGDDLVLNLIKDQILPQFDMEQMARIVGVASSGTSKNLKNRVQSVEQIFTKIAYRIMSRLEELEDAPVGETKIIAKGTVADFIYGEDECPILDKKNESEPKAKIDRKKHPCVDQSVREYIEKNQSEGAAFFEHKLSFDIYGINQDIARGFHYDICQNLNYLNTIVNAYQCDILLLTGRPSKIPGIRTLIETSSFLSPRRIISMHDYRCGSWYPSFSLNRGRIGDPKTAVVVGALLGYIKQMNVSNLASFRINPNYQEAAMPARFMGTLDRDCNLEASEVKYILYTNAEGQYNASLSEGEEFDPAVLFTNENANDAKLDVIRDALSNRELKVNLPINLGYRQFNDPTFKASMLYRIEPFKNIFELRKVKETKNWVVPDINDITFDDEGLSKLSASLFDRLYPDSTENFPAQAREIFSRTRADLEKKQHEAEVAKESSRVLFGASRDGLEVLDLNSPFESIVRQFDEEALKAGEMMAANVKQSGLMAKLTNAAQKALDQKKQGYDSYKQLNQLRIDSAIEEKLKGEQNLIKTLFIRDLCLCVEQAITARRKKEEENLKLVSDAATGNDGRVKHMFDITIKFDDAPMNNNSSIGRCLGFVKEQEKNNTPDLFLLKIIKAEDKTQGARVTDVTGYMNLKLRTVTGDEEYWNNDGLLLKE